MNEIVLICDDNYVLPTAVMVKSVVNLSCHNNNTFYRINICTFGLTEEHTSMLTSLGNKLVQVVIREISECDKIELINQNSHVTPTALIKFELPNIFSKLDQILYLDCDMIIKNNLDSLFEVNIDDYYLAASYDFGEYLNKKYRFAPDHIRDFYFNSGVMLLNLKKMRQDNITKKLWETKLNKYNENKNGKFGLMDQDAFNDVCELHCYKLPIKYNCNCIFTRDVCLKDINDAYKTNYKNVSEIEKDAIVIHYVGKNDKPWKYEGVPCQKYWDDVYNSLGPHINKLIRESNTVNNVSVIKKLSVLINERGLNNSLRYIKMKYKQRKG